LRQAVHEDVEQQLEAFVRVDRREVASHRREVGELRGRQRGDVAARIIRRKLRDRAAVIPPVVPVLATLLEGRSLGWPTWIWLLLVAGLVILGVLGFVEERRHHSRVAPLLRTKLFRIPAFTAGLGVQLAFAAGLQGFFLIFTIWVQAGQHYSPLRAGLTAIAFSAGSFALAPIAVPMALRYGRRVLVAGGASGRIHWHPPPGAAGSPPRPAPLLACPGELKTSGAAAA